MRLVAATLAALALVSACAVTPPPKPPPKPVPVARRPAAPDWFQQQLAAARQAKASHAPKDDAAGAQAAQDEIVRAACVRVALSGPEKYQARCAEILRAVPAADPFACDEPSADPAVLSACND